MQDQLAQMMQDKDKPIKAYILDALCPFPFDKNIDMPPFQGELNCPSMRNTLEFSIPKITYENSKIYT